MAFCSVVIGFSSTLDLIAWSADATDAITQQNVGPESEILSWNFVMNRQWLSDIALCLSSSLGGTSMPLYAEQAAGHESSPAVASEEHCETASPSLRHRHLSVTGARGIVGSARTARSQLRGSVVPPHYRNDPDGHGILEAVRCSAAGMSLSSVPETIQAHPLTVAIRLSRLQRRRSP
jgi:hypothetical protein